jgi:hypothetical protein
LNDLFAGERVLWAGQPQQFKIAWGEAGMAVVGLTAAVLFAVVFVPIAPRDFFALNVSLAAGGLLGAVGWAASPLIVSPRRLRTTQYRITDRRVLIESNWRAHRCDGFYLDQIGEPEVRPRRDGAAELVFPVSNERGKQPSPYPVGPGNQTVSPVVLRGLGQAHAEHAQAIAASAREKWADGQVQGHPAQPAPAALSALPSWFQAHPEERVLWAGRPQRGRWCYGFDLELIMFGAIVLVFAWSFADEATATDNGPTVLAALAGVVGLYFTVGRLVHRRLRIARAAYVLTDRRLVTGWRLVKPVRLDCSLSALGSPSVRRPGKGANNAADIQFSPTPATQMSANRGMMAIVCYPVMPMGVPTLVGVADPDAVSQLIGAAQLNARQAASRQDRQPEPAPE